MTDTVVPPIATDSEGSPSEPFGELVRGVRSVFDSGRTRDLSWRRDQLVGLLDLMKQHEDELVAAIRSDLGRPVLEAFGADIGHARLQIRYLLKHFEAWAKPTKAFPGMLSMPGKARVLHEPLGVALVMAPWNYPLQLLVEPMAAALCAGNCVVAKPSELAPATAATLARLVPKFVDDEAVVIIEGGVAETTSLLEQRFDHIFFTGSTAVGKVVMAAAARHLTPVILELGGKSPTIVAADADIAVAARRIAWGKFINAGQTCIAPDYVLVESSARDELVRELRDAITQFYGRDPKSSEDFGRIVNDRHHARLTGLLEGTGGRVVCGGETDAEQRYVAPTVMVDPDPESQLMTEEIFGPILPILEVSSLDAAIDFVNERPKPLALYLFSKSGQSADRVLSRTTSGGACINHTVVHLLPDDLPFGGVGSSGMGSYHGKAGFDAFSHHRTVLTKPTRPDPSLMYPPYTSMKERVIRRVFG